MRTAVRLSRLQRQRRILVSFLHPSGVGRVFNALISDSLSTAQRELGD